MTLGRGWVNKDFAYFSVFWAFDDDIRLIIIGYPYFLVTYIAYIVMFVGSFSKVTVYDVNSNIMIKKKTISRCIFLFYGFLF